MVLNSNFDLECWRGKKAMITEVLWSFSAAKGNFLHFRVHGVYSVLIFHVKFLKAPELLILCEKSNNWILECGPMQICSCL